jgi:hypothetical protein
MNPVRGVSPSVVGVALALASMMMAPPPAVAATGCAPATVSGATITTSETWTTACSP